MTSYLGVIGGSGLYEIEGLQHPEWVTVDTPGAHPPTRS